MERKVLGRGLDALIPRKIPLQETGGFAYLPLEKIIPGRYQPRWEIGEKELEELAHSIQAKGIIQPIVVRPSGQDSYEVVAGGRRHRASKLLGFKEIPAIIKELDDKDAFIFALVENLQREDLHPLEEAEAFNRLIDEFDLSQEDIAQFVGKDKTTVTNALRLLKLPAYMKEALSQRLITRTQARSLLGIVDKKEQEQLYHQILGGGLSVREIEKKARRVSRRKKKTDPFVREVEDKLQKVLIRIAPSSQSPFFVWIVSSGCCQNSVAE